MATIWTRRKKDVAKDERTAAPWNNVVNAADVSADTTSTSELVLKAKPKDAKVYHTESPK